MAGESTYKEFKEELSDDKVEEGKDTTEGEKASYSRDMDVTEPSKLLIAVNKFRNKLLKNKDSDKKTNITDKIKHTKKDNENRLRNAMIMNAVNYSLNETEENKDIFDKSLVDYVSVTKGIDNIEAYSSKILDSVVLSGLNDLRGNELVVFRPTISNKDFQGHPMIIQFVGISEGKPIVNLMDMRIGKEKGRRLLATTKKKLGSYITLLTQNGYKVNQVKLLDIEDRLGKGEGLPSDIMTVGDKDVGEMILKGKALLNVDTEIDIIDIEKLYDLERNTYLDNIERGDNFINENNEIIKIENITTKYNGKKFETKIYLEDKSISLSEFNEMFRKVTYEDVYDKFKSSAIKYDNGGGIYSSTAVYFGNTKEQIDNREKDFYANSPVNQLKDKILNTLISGIRIKKILLRNENIELATNLIKLDSSTGNIKDINSIIEAIRSISSNHKEYLILYI